MSITLPPDLERIIEDKVASGGYTSPTDVVRQALEMLDARNQRDAENLEALREAARLGDEQLRRDETVEFDVEQFKRDARAEREREWVASVREKVLAGDDQLKRGEGVPLDLEHIKRRGREELERWRNER